MWKKLLVVFLVVSVMIIYFSFGLDRYLNFGYLKTEQARFQEYYFSHRLLTIVVYATIYIVATALSIPGATVMTLAGGAIFGFWMGMVVISFSSTIGATLAFINCRYIFRDFFQEKLKDKLKTINEGVKREGGFYLLTMRLAPMLPFFFVNAAFAKTYMKVTTFYWVSQLGMLPGTALYVNAGTQLSKLESLSGILSPNILIAFALLAIFPLASKNMINIVKARKRLKAFKKPKNFDYNVVVLGAGSGGLVSAYIAAAVKARVALVEKSKMGGDCLNTGCVPSKALIRSAKMVHYAKRATDWGFKSMTVNFDFADIMERVQEVIKRIEPHDSVERYTELGVALRDNGTIETDRFLRTNFPNIYAVGDVTGPFQFTHFASFQGWYAAVNSLFSPFKKFKVDTRIIPWTTFTDPEVARVGLNEQEAINKKIPFEVITYDFKELDRAITDGEDSGFVKVVTPPGKDKILGVSIVGPHAGDILTEFVLAMKNNMGLNKILGTIHVYPTLGEANKAVAGSWKKAHAPETALKWLKIFHSWRR